MGDELTELQSVWDQHAQADPLWAVLSVPSKKGRKWDLAEFLLTGEQDVQHVLKVIEESGTPLRFGVAIDFGCGVGRLTQPLATRFELAMGIDISPTMIDTAMLINRCGNKAQYLLNSVADLGVIPDATADLVFSHIVLQHIPPAQAESYIREFFRIAKPGAAIVFQIPSHLTDEYLPSDYTEDPLPRQACSAAIRLGESIGSIPSGSRMRIKLWVRNLSQQDWKQARVHQLNLANRWRAKDGVSLLIADDGRTRLPGRMKSGEEVALDLEISAPPEPGDYRLEVDVVQEGVRWFQDVGSKCAQFDVEVTADRNHEAASFSVAARNDDIVPETDSDNIPATPPLFEMHGIPRQEILAIIEEYRAHLFRIEEHVDEWYSYRYFIRSSLE